MTSNVVNVGTLPNDNTGSPLRLAFGIVNANFAAIDGLLAALQGAVPVGFAINSTGDLVVTYGDTTSVTLGHVVGPQGPIGPLIGYRWSGTSIAFQNQDGSYGPYVNLAQNPQGTSTVAGVDDGEYDNPAYQPVPATATAGGVDDGTY